MSIASNILFLILLLIGGGYFAYNISKLVRNIKLGKNIDRTDYSDLRLNTMTRVALGQRKMTARPIAGFFHILVYVGFLIINIELLEIIIDGLFGTHRVFAFLGTVYNILIGSFEILALLVLVSVIIFWWRRNIKKISRFWKPEMKGWAKEDGNIILYFEMVLMTLFLVMNAADFKLQGLGTEYYIQAGSFPISQHIAYLLPENIDILIGIERIAWWLHIIGIFFFMNYLYYSKHLHILLAFPNTYYAKLQPAGTLDNLESVKKEVSLMLDPNADPFTAPAEPVGEPEKFGASDATDLNWVQLMNAYTCTECGRCTDNCPANQTGKKLSPRKIMMDTRDRIEEIGENIDKNGAFKPDNKQLLGDYITTEELWACTSCNACVDACPVLIDPLSIIIDLRRYLVMEQSQAPQELNMMMQNIENNMAPWQYGQADRLNWKDEN